MIVTILIATIFIVSLAVMGYALSKAEEVPPDKPFLHGE